MSEPTLPPKTTSPFAAIGAGVAGLLIFIALMAGFYRKETPVWRGADVKIPALQEQQQEPEWVDERGLNLPPVGYLPSLQSAMARNPALREKVRAFAQKDDADIFANYRQTDADITAILLLWSGADLTQTRKTQEGLDPRIDHFLRRVFSLGGLEAVAENPRLGRDPWPRLFAYYKVRLIAQTPGGQAPFAKAPEYEIGRDRLSVSGGLSRAFFSQFGSFIRSQPNAAAYRANLLAYVKAVDGALAESDAQTMALIQ